MAIRAHHGFSAVPPPGVDASRLMIGTGHGGAVDPNSIVEAVERHASLEDNQLKLAALPVAARRHLFVHLGASYSLAAVALSRVLDGAQPFPRLPALPNVITTAWASVGSGLLYATPPECWRAVRV
jgi:hypothetical protein